MKTWSDLSKLKTFDERFRYLMIGGSVGEETFGMDRFLNQMFYTSYEWRHIRNEVILRDNGCDLGVEGFEIFGKILIHHMNPITKRDILDRTDILMNPEYLITVSHETHNALHYGDDRILQRCMTVERYPNDQCPWRK